VLRKPLGLNLFDEDLSQEKDQLIFTALSAGRLAACLMLKIMDTKVVKLRQMGVHADFQRQKIGTTLVKRVEKWCLENGYQTI